MVAKKARGFMAGEGGELGQQIRDHVGRIDTGEAEIETLGADAEALVVDAQLMQDRGVNVVDVDGILDSAKAEFVRPTVDLARLKAAACKPHGEGVDRAVPRLADASVMQAAASFRQDRCC